MARKQAKRLSLEQFVDHYVRALSHGMDREQLSEEIGLTSDSIYLRARQIRNETGIDLPNLPARQKKSKTERAKAALAAAKRKYGRVKP